jgi:hypothetical protein
MLLAWKAAHVTVFAGYILGFPADTPESIRRDIGIIQRELPIDLLEFHCLTPLPGSEDHQRLYKAGTYMEPDLNKYDLEHATMAHPRMSKDEWEGIYQESWRVYFSPEHMKTVMRRAAATGISAGKVLFLLVWYYGCAELENIHPLQGGYLRRKYRRDRRPPMPIESPLVFYPRYFADLIYKHLKLGVAIMKYGRFRQALKKDPNASNYTDTALTPVTEEDFDSFDLFNVNAAAKMAADKARHPGLTTIA